MKKMYKSVLLLLLSSVLCSQILPTLPPNYWTINVFVGCYKDEVYNPPVISSTQTDVAKYDLVSPVIFKLPDKYDKSKIIGINDYVYQYGDSIGNYIYTIPYYPFMEQAISSFWKNMFKDTKSSYLFPDSIRFNFVWAPDGGTWVANKLTGLRDGTISEISLGMTLFDFEQNVKDTIDLYSDSNIYKTWNYYHDRSIGYKQLSMFMLPSFVDNNSDLIYGGYTDSGIATTMRVMYRFDRPDETTRVIAHEMGHLIPSFRDHGSASGKTPVYSGYIEVEGIIKPMGTTFSTAGCYDIMHSYGGQSGGPPECLYGIPPFFTEDLINVRNPANLSQYLDIKNNTIDENPQNNTTLVRIKAIREFYSDTDEGSVFQTISLPIDGDRSVEGEINGSWVKNQKFLIEYRNGTGFDNLTSMFQNSISEGILISHIINDTVLYSNKLGRIADIECAVPFSKYNIDSTFYRDPSTAWPAGNTTGINGEYYMGKDVNDWLDDLSADATYTFEGGKGTWYRESGMVDNQSLPSDFFNDTDRNKFTPSTRPNTNSWKDAETNIGVFIDKIEGDYADLRIYRNYHSVPLTRSNAKLLPDGNNGLSIMNDGYIGERFYVDSLTWLYLGTKNPDLPDDFIPTTTLVPGTYMHVRNGGYLQLKNDSKLRLENSKLEFRKGSKFAPFAVAGIEIENSEMIFQDGYIQQDYNLVNYFISESGASSFYNSNFNMIGSSLLTLNENSKFTVLSGSNVTLSSQSVLTLRSGSHLNIEGGSAVYLSAGTRLVVEGNAEITGNLVVGDGAIIEIRDNAKLLVNNSNINVHPATSVTLGISSVLEIGANSTLTLDGSLSVLLGDDASIIIKDNGSLITTNLGTENVTFRNSGETWYAIMCEVGSKIELYGAEIIGADIGIWGTPDFCRIENSSFLDCENGISIVNCPDYVITNNRMTGKGLNSYGYAKGSGITLTNCTLPISGNTIQNYADGIKLVSSSIILAENRIINNYNSGLLITGNGSKPVLVNSLSKDLIPRLNNEIYGNNIDYPIYNGAQIYMRYSAGAYLTGGYNNIYSGQIGVVPSVPCIRGILVTSPEPVISKVLISAERNYWGYGSIDEINQPDFFFFRNSTFDTGYSIAFDPYALVPYTIDGAASTDLSSNEPRSSEETLLLNAMKLEDTGSSKASIKLYENIIKKYPSTPEYYVAESRLPGLYIKEEIPLEELLTSFNENIEEETVLGKKFFKGLRVSTHIKAKNYDTAIMYAEEMKNEAETEEEALLSDIDIAVANMMKESEGKGKSDSPSDSLEKLLNMLNGKDSKDGSPSEITESSLPTQHELFQNYPNPFNPVTQIKFALAKTSDVRLSVYNISGQKIAELANGTINAGYHTVDFDGSRFNSGVYYYMLEADGRNITKKMVLTK